LKCADFDCALNQKLKIKRQQSKTFQAVSVNESQTSNKQKKTGFLIADWQLLIVELLNCGISKNPEYQN
jgi:hypothetical protein